MMSVGNKIVGLLFVLVAVGLAGCGRVGRLDERDRNSRIVSRAYEMANQGDYDSAITLFTKALETYPRLSRPHLDLALLLHDRRHDYVRAIYHYNRYLELRPGTEKASMIKDRIRQAERAFGAIYTADGTASPKVVLELEAANADLRRRNTSLEAQIDNLEQEIEVAREQERLRFKATVVGDDAAKVDAPEVPLKPKPKPTVPAVESPPAPGAANQKPNANVEPRSAEVADRAVATQRPTGKPSAAPEPKPTVETTREPVVRTYTVRRGDSLSKIAYKVYGDATQWRKIQDANAESLGDSVNVKVGQLLVVP